MKVKMSINIENNNWINAKLSDVVVILIVIRQKLRNIKKFAKDYFVSYLLKSIDWN